MRVDKLLIIIIILISTLSYAKEEIIFTINNKPITTIDLNQRINYLSLWSTFKKNKISEKYFLDDLISIQLFDVFAKRKKLNIEKVEINDVFNKIINNLTNQELILYNELKKNNELTNNIILENIRYDLQRQKIIETLLKQKISKISLSKNKYDIINIFDIKFNYFTVSSKYREKINEISNELLSSEVYNIKEILNNSNIEYNYFSIDLIKLDQLDEQIINNISKDNKKFIINKGDYLIIGSIVKSLKKDIGLKYSFFQITKKINANTSDLENESINCINIDEIKSNDTFEVIEYKSIELEKLNISIFENLSNVNNKLIIKNNDKNLLILLCSIEYNKEIVESELYQKNLQKIANEIEIEFIKTKRKEYNFNFVNN